MRDGGKKLQGSVSELYSLQLRWIRSIISSQTNQSARCHLEIAITLASALPRPAQGRILGGDGSKTENPKTKIADHLKLYVQLY
jgi:hypothetical protein